MPRGVNTLRAQPVDPVFAGQGDNIMQQAHAKAAEQHDTAAKSHRAAAGQHGENDRATGKEH